MVIARYDSHVFQSLDEAVPVPIITGNFNLYFLGAKGDLTTGPEAFLAECVKDHEIDSHFHKADQFQIMFGAPGAYYQRTPLPRVLLHYADAYAVYGPFGTGPQSRMNFFTLRGAASDFHGSMPRDRDHLPYRDARHRQIDLEPLLERGVLRDGDSQVDVVIPAEVDGLAAYLLRIAPGATASPPTGELRTGRYTVVLEGEMGHAGRSFGPRSLGWSGGQVPEIIIEGGPQGACVLFLHLPYPATPTARLGR